MNYLWDKLNIGKEHNMSNLNFEFSDKDLNKLADQLAVKVVLRISDQLAKMEKRVTKNLNIKEACEYIGVSYPTFRRIMKESSIGLQIGKKYIFSTDELDALINTNTKKRM